MKILVVNTASLEAQLALLCENEKIYKTLDASMKHSENLLPEIEKLLSLNKIKVKDLDAIAVNVGPGSFTGLRISIATVKAFLNVFSNIKCIGITSFELIANEFYKNNNEKASVVIDALSNLFYLQTFENNKPTSEAKLISKEEILSLENVVSDNSIENEKTTVVNLTCENLLDVAINKFNKKVFVSESELLPLYIRPSQAETNRK